VYVKFVENGFKISHYHHGSKVPPPHAASSLADFSTLKLEAIRSSETSVHTISTRCEIPEYGILSVCNCSLTNIPHVFSRYIERPSPYQTNSMEPSPSWEATSRAATQECSNILWNSKKYQYRVHKSPPLFSVFNQINTAHATPSYLSKIRLNVILPPTSSSS
jgi:hypothetical protein